MESTIKWQTGTPTIGGEYLVCLKDGIVTTDKFLVVDGLERDWKRFNKSYVVGWCKLSNIVPYSIKQEDKDLLLKDLCCRLPYGVKCENYNHVYGKNIFKVTDIRDNGYICGTINNQHGWAVFDPLELKPYLFPLSSMTVEQKIECFRGTPLEIDKYGDISVKDNLYGGCQYTDLEIYLEVIDWLNKNHFDYRGLIKLGLAIDATGLGIY